MEVDLILKNGFIVPVTEEPFHGSIAIEDNKIVAVIKKEDIDRFSGPSIDLDGSIVIPGLMNTHTHLAMTMFRGYADDLPLDKWLEDYIWPLEQKLGEKEVYYGSLLGCLEMIKSGVTFFADMYVELDQVAKAVDKTGMRAALSYGMISVNKDEIGVEKELKEGLRVYNELDGAADGRITTTVGPHSPSTCSRQFLKKLNNSIPDGLIQTHLAETKEEYKKLEKEEGVTPTKFLDEVGLLNENTVCAHANHLDEKDIELLSSSGASVSHNPTSNMKLASGVAPVPKLIEKGVPVALGTDGAASNNSLDLFGEMKTAALLHKSNEMDPTVVPAQKALEMATINGARAFGLEEELGSIEEGKKADLVIVDNNSPRMTPNHNVISNLVYSATNKDVETVIIDGEVIMKDREITRFDENEVIDSARKISKKIVEK